MMQFQILPPMIFGLHENRAEAEAFVSEWAVEGCGTLFLCGRGRGADGSSMPVLLLCPISLPSKIPRLVAKFSNTAMHLCVSKQDKAED